LTQEQQQAAADSLMGLVQQQQPKDYTGFLAGLLYAAARLWLFQWVLDKDHQSSTNLQQQQQQCHECNIKPGSFLLWPDAVLRCYRHTFEDRPSNLRLGAATTMPAMVIPSFPRASAIYRLPLIGLYTCNSLS
jgi:hypothetical protein